MDSPNHDSNSESQSQLGVTVRNQRLWSLGQSEKIESVGRKVVNSGDEEYICKECNTGSNRAKLHTFAILVLPINPGVT